MDAERQGQQEGSGRLVGSAIARRLLGWVNVGPIVAEGTIGQSHRWTLALGANVEGGAAAEVCLEERGGAAMSVGASRHPQPDGTVLGGRGHSAHGRRRCFCWCTTVATTSIRLDTDRGTVHALELAADQQLGVRVFLSVLDDPDATTVRAVHASAAGQDTEEDLAGAQASFAAHQQRLPPRAAIDNS